LYFSPGVESHISSGRNSIGTFGDYPTSPGLVTDEGVNGRINSQASNVNVKEGSESYSNSMASCSVAVASSPFGGRVSSSYNDSCSITGSGFVNAKDNETDEIRSTLNTDPVSFHRYDISIFFQTECCES